MTPPTQVLSETFSEKIAGRRVLAALFTTYTFDPAFFELDILPVLFEGRISGGFSPNEKMRRVQLEECLRGDETEVDVFYDRGGLVANAQPASLDFRRIDVACRAGVFHPKLVLVLLEDPPAGDSETTRSKSLIVAALSANLTRSGWWENLETGHIEVIEEASKKNWRCTFREDLLDALAVIGKASDSGHGSGAMGKILTFLEEDAPQEGIKNAHTRGNYYTRLYSGTAAEPGAQGTGPDQVKAKPLPEWLRDRSLHSQPWKVAQCAELGQAGGMEVVSPYFDANEAKALKTLLVKLAWGKRPEVRVLLPTEPDGTPAVTQKQYEAVANLEGVRWSRLPQALSRASATSRTEGAAARRVHAKIYRFWRRGELDVSLVGSPNLTCAGHSGRNNVEAAFLVNSAGDADRGNSADWWLEPLEPDEAPERFKEEAETEDADAERVGLPLSLRYDWGGHELKYRLDDSRSRHHDGELHIERIAGGELWTISRPERSGKWIDCGAEAADRVRNLLSSTSLVMARTVQRDGGRKHWRVLIREEGMAHKPSLLDKLTAEEILEYWSLLTEAQKQQFLASRLETDGVLPGLLADERPSTTRGQRTAFDRFSGLFHAFGRLSKWIDEQLEENRHKQAAVRLLGQKHDSLPLLLEKVVQGSGTPSDGRRDASDPESCERSTAAGEPPQSDVVTAYLTFLCAKQIACRIERDHPQFWKKYAEDRGQLELQLKKIEELREALPLQDTDRERFLDWYEEAFLRDSASLAGTDDQTSSETGE